MSRGYRDGRRTSPQRPFRSLEEFRRRHFLLQAATEGKWPCLTCLGWGQVYDEADPPDPVEGNRHRRTFTCTACGGSGHSTRQAVAEAYRKAIKAWRAEKQDYDRAVRIRDTARQRLTEEEIQAIRELGV
jgi:hypothetical protein